MTSLYSVFLTKYGGLRLVQNFFEAFLNFFNRGNRDEKLNKLGVYIINKLQSNYNTKLSKIFISITTKLLTTGMIAPDEHNLYIR